MFSKIADEEEILPQPFFDINIMRIPKSGWNYMRKENYRLVSIINKNARGPEEYNSE